MSNQQPVRATIAIRVCDQHKLVTDRVAARYITRTLTSHRYREKCQHDLKESCRRFILNRMKSECSGESIWDPYRTKLVGLAKTLENVCAIEFPNQPHLEDCLATTNSEYGAMEREIESNFMSLEDHPDVQREISALPLAMHPLFILLLAYSMGGPINAANTAHCHDWRKSDEEGAHLPYMEGDTGDILDNYRLTFVWERCGDDIRELSGDHHIFLTGDTTPRHLVAMKSAPTEKKNPATIVIYHAKTAALYYECEDPTATRSGISLDFHVNRMLNDDLLLLGIPPCESNDLENLTLSKLLTTFPVHDYTSHFHRLLFSPSSIQSIFSALDNLTIPLVPSPLLPPSAATFEARYHHWDRDNLAHIPRSLTTMPRVALLGTYTSQTAFQHRLAFEMHVDMHGRLGMNLFPSTWVDGHREVARKWIRSLPGDFIVAKLAPYMASLTSHFPITREHVLPTRSMSSFARRIERKCLEVISLGCKDEMGLLYSMGALARAIGDAVDGVKELAVVPKPWIDEMDLRIFRARCVYLFWCADWVAKFLADLKPVKEGIEGVVSVAETEEERAKMEAKELRGIAVRLLGNWMAWAFIAEGLPGRPFRVRRPVMVL